MLQVSIIGAADLCVYIEPVPGLYAKPALVYDQLLPCHVVAVMVVAVKPGASVARAGELVLDFFHHLQFTRTRSACTVKACEWQHTSRLGRSQHQHAAALLATTGLPETAAQSTRSLILRMHGTQAYIGKVLGILRFDEKMQGRVSAECFGICCKPRFLVRVHEPPTRGYRYVVLTGELWRGKAKKRRTMSTQPPHVTRRTM